MDAAVDGPADAAAADRTGPPVYKDERGILLPSSELPLGTALPVEMKKVASGRNWSRYEGKWTVKEVLAFYKVYLTLPEGAAMEEKGRAIIFRNARPVLPGNPGRLVEVRVVDERHMKKVAVEIYDLDFKEKQKKTDWSAVPPVDPRKWKPSKPGELPPDEFM
jgi:hypothetical protein